MSPAFTSPERSIATRRHAAIDDDFGAGNEFGFVGRQKQCGIGGVAPIAHEARWNALAARREQGFDIAAGALPGPTQPAPVTMATLPWSRPIFDVSDVK